MNETLFTVAILLEVASTIFIAWGIMHEERLVAFENAICKKIKKKINRLKRDACVRYLSKQGIIIPKTKGDK